ncbi:hypothetical protein [Limimaricola cinnabarinus]|uniref:Uncharacterized protein n=1 Tax=Limimaricola cinnabarinus TaxID=1125964 RepID=A0A2G1MBY9_9RHOB|nr:hypothetical protein [Limimaricola cinnabarinus]PHP26182.1 hypothetical protein CJ301_17810 [Limimaricola cinnabarinus]
MLHLLDVQDAFCLARLRDRNVRGDHPSTVSDAQFRQNADHFVAPTSPGEIEIRLHGSERYLTASLRR